MQLTTECKVQKACFLNKFQCLLVSIHRLQSKQCPSPPSCSCHWDLLNSSTTRGLSLNSPQQLGSFQDFSKYVLCCNLNSLSLETVPTFLVTSEFNSLSSDLSLCLYPVFICFLTALLWLDETGMAHTGVCYYPLTTFLHGESQLRAHLQVTLDLSSINLT